MAQSAKAQLSEQEVNDFDIQDNREEFEMLLLPELFDMGVNNYYFLYHFEKGFYPDADFKLILTNAPKDKIKGMLEKKTRAKGAIDLKRIEKKEGILNITDLQIYLMQELHPNRIASVFYSGEDYDVEVFDLVFKTTK